MTWKHEYEDTERRMLTGDFAAIPPDRRAVLDAQCMPLPTDAQVEADMRQGQQWFEEHTKEFSPAAAEELWCQTFTDAYEQDSPNMPTVDPIQAIRAFSLQQPQNAIECDYVAWCRSMFEWKRREELAERGLAAEDTPARDTI